MKNQVLEFSSLEGLKTGLLYFVILSEVEESVTTVLSTGCGV
jgi:hypothetical protein